MRVSQTNDSRPFGKLRGSGTARDGPNHPSSSHVRFPFDEDTFVLKSLLSLVAGDEGKHVTGVASRGVGVRSRGIV